MSPCSEIDTTVPPYLLFNLATRNLESPFENPGYAPDKGCHTQIISLVLHAMEHNSNNLSRNRLALHNLFLIMRARILCFSDCKHT